MPGFSDEQLLERHRSSQLAFYRLLASGHPDTSVATPRAGLQAVVAPVSPDRSLPNSVLYRDPAPVIEAHDELAALYEDAGVRAWTVWVRPGDDELCAELEARGHAIDATPGLMVAAMEELDLEPRVDLDLADGARRWSVVGELNDVAYGLPPGALGAVVAGVPPGDYDLLIARRDGEAVACAVFETV